MAGRISELLDGITIEDILERLGLDYSVTHGGSGEQVNIEECPFCGGSEWKVYANRDTGLGNCFHGSCQATFNRFGFVRSALQTEDTRSVREFLEALARDIGWRPNRRRQKIDVETDDAVDWKMPQSYALPTDDGRNLRYLEERGIDGDAAAHFGLRYCHDGSFPYTKSDGTKTAMPFRERVLIPVHDLDATLVTFQGRDLTGKSDRKYLFPPGLPGTSAFLYNGHRAAGKGQMILCEGAFDVIRAWLQVQGTCYEDWAVAGSFGIQLSKGRDGKDQVAQLLRLKKGGLSACTVMWDGEPNAFRKAMAACETLVSIGLEARIACLPAGKDPADADGGEILKALDTALPYSKRAALRWRITTPYG